MHAIICIHEFMNFMLFLIKFIKFRQRLKFKNFELHNYGVGRPARLDEVVRVATQSEDEHWPDANRLRVLRQFQLRGLVEGRLVERPLAGHKLAPGHQNC